VIGTNVEYAPYVEPGTHKQKAQPYLRPAAENHSAEYKEIIKAVMANA
jgi:HK97 gp10 family phage protein